MASTPTEYFERLIQQFQSAFDNVVVEQDKRPARARLEMVAAHGPYRVRLVEIVLPDAE